MHFRHEQCHARVPEHRAVRRRCKHTRRLFLCDGIFFDFVAHTRGDNADLYAFPPREKPHVGHKQHRDRAAEPRQVAHKPNIPHFFDRDRHCRHLRLCVSRICGQYPDSHIAAAIRHYACDLPHLSLGNCGGSRYNGTACDSRTHYMGGRLLSKERSCGITRNPPRSILRMKKAIRYRACSAAAPTARFSRIHAAKSRACRSFLSALEIFSPICYYMGRIVFILS